MCRLRFNCIGCKLGSFILIKQEKKPFLDIFYMLFGMTKTDSLDDVDCLLLAFD